MTLYSLISKFHQSEKIFLKDLSGRSVSYRDFFQFVDSMAENLLTFASAKHVVLIDAPKSIDSIILVFACIKLGLGYCFVDPSLPKERKDNIYKAVKPVLICSEVGGRLHYSSDLSESLNEKRVFSGGIVFTSGSTGNPKGVLNSYESLAAYVASMLEIMGEGGGAKWLSICPAHFDVFQLDFLVQSARGASVVIAPNNLLPQQYIHILVEEKVNEFLSISTLLKMFVDATPSSRVEGVDRVYYGGEGCTISVLRKIKEIFINARFCQFYGPTENCNNTTFFKFDEPYETESGYMPLGHPVKNTHLTLRCDDGRVAEVGESGQIFISGPQILAGYLSVETGELMGMREREYASGDYGHIDSAGLLWFEGRKDDIVKVNGNRVSLLEVSSEISKLVGATSTVATIVIEKNGYSSILSGYTLSDGGVESDEVYERLSSVLPKYALPKKILVIDPNEVQRLSTGKTDMKKFKELLEVRSQQQGVSV